MYRKIVVPLDGSDFAEHAIPIALAIARSTSAELHLVNVTGPLLPTYASVPAGGQVFDSSALEREMRDEMLAYLAALQNRLPPSAEGSCVTAILMGDPGDAVAEYALAQEAGLIVMATHGRGGLNRTWLGSVAEAIVRRAAMPVILARPAADTPVDLQLAFSPGRVLVPLQESDFSESVVPFATEIAEALSAEMVLAEIVIPLEIRSRVVAAPGRDREPAQVELAVSRANDYLERTAALLRERGLNASTRVITAPHAAAAILQLADEVDAGIIAMATHGRRGVARLMFGSVTDKVVRGAMRAVLLYRPRSGD